MSHYKETTGYVIHTRSFKNTSLIIEFFSIDIGLINLIAKGIKKNKKLKYRLQFFSLLKIQYFGRSQLKTIVSIDVISPITFDLLIEKTAGLYLNELLRYSLLTNDQAPLVFNSYEKSISLIGKVKLPIVLRVFEKSILKFNGFELQINPEFSNNQWISISDIDGIIIAKSEQQGLCLVSDLKSFIVNEVLKSDVQKRINSFMMAAINICFMNRKLFSRELLISMTRL